MHSKWVAVSAFLLLSIFGAAQVKSIEGGGGRLVTRHTPPPAAKPLAGMTNQDVLDLVDLGLADDIVIQKIQSSTSTSFDTSIAGLKSLKAAKVSDNIIRVMLNPHAPVVVNVPAISTPESALLPKEVGVYVRLKDKLTEVEPEIVGWQTLGLEKYCDRGSRQGAHQRQNHEVEKSA